MAMQSGLSFAWTAHQSNGDNLAASTIWDVATRCGVVDNFDKRRPRTSPVEPVAPLPPQHHACAGIRDRDANHRPTPPAAVCAELFELASMKVNDGLAPCGGGLPRALRSAPAISQVRSGPEAEMLELGSNGSQEADAVDLRPSRVAICRRRCGSRSREYAWSNFFDLARSQN